MALTKALFRAPTDCTAHIHSEDDAWPRPDYFREQGLDRNGPKIRKLHKGVFPWILGSVVRGMRVCVYKNWPSHLPSHAARNTLSPSHESGSFVLRNSSRDRGNGSHQVLYRLVKWVASHLLTAEPVKITVAAKPTWWSLGFESK